MKRIKENGEKETIWEIKGVARGRLFFFLAACPNRGLGSSRLYSGIGRHQQIWPPSRYACFSTSTTAATDLLANESAMSRRPVVEPQEDRRWLGSGRPAEDRAQTCKTEHARAGVACKCDAPG